MVPSCDFSILPPADAQNHAPQSNDECDHHCKWKLGSPMIITTPIPLGKDRQKDDFHQNDSRQPGVPCPAPPDPDIACQHCLPQEQDRPVTWVVEQVAAAS